MYNLEIPANKMRQFKELANDANLVFRSKRNGDVMTINFKKEEYLNKAKEIVKQFA